MDYIEQLINRYPVLNVNKNEIKAAFEIIAESFGKGGKLLIAGNGGSAADAEHIAGELMKNFVKKRKLPGEFTAAMENVDTEISSYILPRLQPGLPVIALSANVSLNTACINDIDGNIAFAQQAYAYGKEEDVLLAISTSGNSKNVIYACAVAKAKNIKIIGLTGTGGGKIKNFCDACICVPETETYKIQELHMPVYHCLCLMLEEKFFN